MNSRTEKLYFFEVSIYTVECNIKHNWFEFEFPSMMLYSQHKVKFYHVMK